MDTSYKKIFVLILIMIISWLFLLTEHIKNNHNDVSSLRKEIHRINNELQGSRHDF